MPLVKIIVTFGVAQLFRLNIVMFESNSRVNWSVCPSFARVWKFRRDESRILAFTAVHLQSFPLPLYVLIDDLPHVTSALTHNNDQTCMLVKGCEWKIPTSPAMEFLNWCQEGTNALGFSRIMLTNNDASVKC
jgi:hypothetical protein